MQQSSYQDNRQQLLLMGTTIFVSITVAVFVSTMIIMSLMRGEIASALSSTIQNSSPTAQVANSCAVPSSEASASADAAGSTAATATYLTPVAAAAPLMNVVHFAKHVPPATINNSFNSSNVSNTTTTNNVENTEINKTTIINSFNEDSFNPVVIEDNEVNINSHNAVAVNSGNTLTSNNTTTNTTNTIVTAVNSGNTTNSNNTVENHLLSDNTVVVVPTP